MHMVKYLELRRHTDNDGDALSADGIEAALQIGAGLHGTYHLGVSTGAQRATQTLACFLATLQERVPRGVLVEAGLRSDNEDRWKQIAKDAGAKKLSDFRAADGAFVEDECRQLGDGLRAVFAALDDQQRALVAGHSPTNEAAVYGLTGEEIPPMSKGGGVLLVQDGESFRLEQLA